MSRGSPRCPQGARLPSHLVVCELQRQLDEGIRTCPALLDQAFAEGVKWEGMQVHIICQKTGTAQGRLYDLLTLQRKKAALLSGEAQQKEAGQTKSEVRPSRSLSRALGELAGGGSDGYNQNTLFTCVKFEAQIKVLLFKGQTQGSVVARGQEGAGRAVRGHGCLQQCHCSSTL